VRKQQESVVQIKLQTNYGCRWFDLFHICYNSEFQSSALLVKTPSMVNTKITARHVVRGVGNQSGSHL